ncbi:hypothetical protein EXS65_01555 [Candidatus Peribacteria bacterium]|nr:hypothetical protein [Candidatus Peribacteria bacterium]
MASAEHLKAQLTTLKDESQRLSADFEMLSQAAHVTFAKIMKEPDVLAAQVKISDAAVRVDQLSLTTDVEMSDEQCFTEGLRQMQRVVTEKKIILGKLTAAMKAETAITDEDELMFEPK